MQNVLLIFIHPDTKILTEVSAQLIKRGDVASVTNFKTLVTALQKPYDEVAIIIDSMTLATRIVKIVARHKHTKDALVSIWQNSSLSLRGGMSVTCKATAVPRQLADMDKTQKEAKDKALQQGD